MEKKPKKHKQQKHKSATVAHRGVPVDWQPVPHRSLSWKRDPVKTACILARSRSVYLPEQLVGEFHSQAAAAFHPSSAIKSLQMQMLPERHAAAAAAATSGGGGGVGAERGAARRGPASASRGGHCSPGSCRLFSVLDQLQDRHPLSATTEECEAPSIQGREKRERDRVGGWWGVLPRWPH